MVKRRAVEKGQSVSVEGAKPPGYTTIVPLTPQQHSGLKVLSERSYGVAEKMNAIPLTCDEFPQAMRHYPIVMTSGTVPTPLALVGLQQGQNAHVDADGTWRKGTYIPAYLRRYPYVLVRASEGADKTVLCADLSSTQFSETEGTPLFDKSGEAGEPLTNAIDFCTRYERAALRTAEVMQIVADHDLLQASAVNMTRGERTSKIEGFSMISEEKLRALPDATLASLARRGVLQIFTAHHLSLANFSDFGDGL